VSYELAYRLWLRKDERFIISEGRARLLKLIKKYGSLARAADEMAMSYRHAWGVIKKIEESTGERIVVSERGGQEGGASNLTPEGLRLLEQYESQKRVFDDQLRMMYKRPILAADGIILEDNSIVLIKRGKDPHKGRYALPGGIVEYGEKIEDCVIREVREETGLETRILDLIGIYSDPSRDPRGHVISAVFHLFPVGGTLRGGDDATDACLFPLNKIPDLAFDHREIIRDFMISRNEH
jgi:8-oxo-dGTP diphosphatase